MQVLLIPVFSIALYESDKFIFVLDDYCTVKGKTKKTKILFYSILIYLTHANAGIC